MAFPEGFDKEGRPKTIEAARKAINQIRSDRGHIDQNDEYQISKTDAEWQLSYRKKAEKYRQLYARYTKTVAEQLYSSKFRFIHELLQNADDAKYPTGVEPTIAFRITHAELIVELNERGFTLPDVDAICDTGMSSKYGDAGTTGEKGLGFKSVFGIARTVNIQSNLWSFRFEHQKGDDGVGMITPIWTPAADGISRHVGTCYKLEFCDTRESFVKQLIAEFEKLPKTIIFALRQICKLEVVMENVYGHTASIILHRQGRLDDEKLRIESTVSGTFGKHVSHTAYFKPFQRTITNLPVEDLRPSHETTVSIAFEVCEDGTPVIPARGQHIFAYLPVQRLAQLPFLIQADFVLAANREAVPDSDWNQALRKGIAEAFAQAIYRICYERQPLTFTWMQFYPLQSMEGVWDDLEQELYDALKFRRILRSRNDRLRYVAHTRDLPEWFFHEDEPIVPDTSEDVYLSSTYSSADIKILRTLGLKQLSNKMMVDRIQDELSSGRIHRRPLDDAWHSAFTEVLTILREDPESRTLIDSLAVIPLEDGNWVSPRSLNSNRVYLPVLIDEDAVKIRIPSGLGFQILHPSASAVGERVTFYNTLGICSCNPDEVIPRIFNAHKNSTSRNAPLTEWLADLEILFWYGQPSKSGDLPRYIGGQYTDLWAVSDKNKLHRPTTLFFPSENACDAHKLLSRTPRDDYKSYGFLDDAYIRSKVREKIRHNLDWMSWLQKSGITYYPSLSTLDSKGKRILNPLLRLVARDNGEMFIENLKEHWPNYSFRAKAVATELGNLTIPCLGDMHHPIKNTLLPTEAILTESRQLRVVDMVPFLKLPQNHGEPKLDDWGFLEQFGVTCEVNSAFYLMALQALLKQEHDSSDLTTIASTIYAGIGQCSQIKDGPTLQRAFEVQPLIYAHSESGSTWKKRTQCAWDGMSCLSTVQVLSPIYGKDNSTATFFKTILKIRDASHKDLFEELKVMASSNQVSEHHAGQKLPQIYAKLSEMSQPEEVKEQIRTAFSTYSLIYVRGRWLKPLECLWNCTVEISGKVPLDRVYPRLRKFFVDDLRVMTMTPNLLVQELTKLAKARNPDLSEARRIMIAIGQILATAPNATITERDLTALKKSAFLPVCNPDGRSLTTIAEAFCINDHRRYGDAFRNKARILDFDYEDLTSLHPLFQLLGLEHRYMSSLVEASTTIESSRLSEDLTEHIRSLAYALSCCAIAYNSTRYLNKKTSTHELLTNTEISVCDGMWTELTIREPDRDVIVRSDRAVVKIDEFDDCLRLYVPSDRDGLYSCYCTELPGELAKVLGIEDRGATKTIYRILNDQAKDLDTIMRDEDLSEYPWIPKPSRLPRAALPALPSLDIESQESDVQQEVRTSNQDNVLITVRPRTNGDIEDSSPRVNLEPEVNLRIFDEPLLHRVARAEQYRKLLQEVTRQARRVPRESRDPFSLSQIDDAIDEVNNAVDYAEFRANLSGGSTFEDNARIGAAGELFVYERLRALGVNDFTIDNWQSTIRRYVNVHPDYRDMADWTGREVSDLMYTGSCSRLTKFLIECSRPHQYPVFLNDGLSRPVNIHLEVKTSTGGCTTPFYMSHHQYQLMRQKACAPNSREAPTDLYVVLRVYNLLSSQIRVRAYINPWHLRDDVLEFVADPWKVVPTLE